jgi:hypothetical protein
MGQNSVFRKDGIYLTKVNLILSLINCLKGKKIFADTENPEAS